MFQKNPPLPLVYTRDVEHEVHENFQSNVPIPANSSKAPGWSAIGAVCYVPLEYMAEGYVYATHILPEHDGRVHSGNYFFDEYGRLLSECNCGAFVEWQDDCLLIVHEERPPELTVVT